MKRLLSGWDRNYLSRLTSPNFVWTVRDLFIRHGSFESRRCCLICNPNNPTGSVAPVGQLLEIAEENYWNGIFIYSRWKLLLTF